MPASDSKSTLAPGTRVATRGEQWTVDTTRGYGECQAIGLSSAADGALRRRTLLRPFDRIVPVAPPPPRVCGRRAWARHALASIAGAEPFGAVEAAAAAGIELLPFQLEPAIAALRYGHTRLLIADDVGLGKTIQAALLLAEVVRRGHAVRAVVLSPASLVEQWSRELRERFALAPVVVDAALLAERARTLPPDVNPWCLPGVYLVSIDFVKQPEVLGSIEQTLWDLAVVDEAHNAAIGTHRRAAAQAIASRARRVVLLTATPPEGDRQQLPALLHIGSLDDPVAQFKRTRADVGLVSDRHTSALLVRLSAAERRLHRALERYTKLLWRSSGSGARLLAVLVRKRALSSAAALGLSIDRRCELLDGAPSALEHQMLLPLDERTGDDPGDDLLGMPGLADPAHERKLLIRLRRLAANAAHCESKVRALCRFVRRAREPVIVFTEYRDTLLQLQDALRLPGRDVVTLHGGLTARERADACRAFDEHGTVLLATDAAAEGLNLHRRCRVVVHFELPWMPARLEQRTGRVDRIGQRARVHELFFVARHTAERLVLLPLLRRVRAASAGRGHRHLMRLTEAAVAAAVISGEAITGADNEPSSVLAPVRFATEAAVEFERLTRQRRTLGTVARARGREHVAATVARRGPPACATLLFHAALVDQNGRRVHTESMTLRVEWAHRMPRSHYYVRQLARQISCGAIPAIERLVRDLTRESFATIQRLYESAERAVSHRTSAIASQPSAARRLAQGGLFDRRAVTEWRRAKQAQELIQAEPDASSPAAASRLVPTMTLRAVRLESRG